MIYLDHAASTPMLPGAIDVLQKTSMEDFANPSSSHKLGKEILRKIEEARLDFLEAAEATQNYNFIFTGSATESNNSVIKQLKLNDNDEIVVGLWEHPSLTKPAKLWSEKDIKLVGVPVDSRAMINEDELFNKINQNTKLLLLSHVNNTSGNICMVSNLSKHLKKNFPDLWIHVDAVQSFGKIKLELDKSSIDSVSIAGHKMGGPKGIAGLYLRKTAEFEALFLGGGQELGLRSSTESWPLINSWHFSMSKYIEEREKNYLYVDQLNELLRNQLTELIPEVEFPFLTESKEKNCPYILTFILPGISSDILIRHLEMDDIFVSSSSACSSKLKGENPVFSALKISIEKHNYVIRSSFSPRTPESDIIQFVQAVSTCHKKLMKIKA